MKWISVKDELPSDNEKVLVNKRYHYRKDGFDKVYYMTQLLVFNEHHNCWDGEDGDDFDCSINQVSHWIKIPEPPTNERH